MEFLVLRVWVLHFFFFLENNHSSLESEAVSDFLYVYLMYFKTISQNFALKLCGSLLVDKYFLTSLGLCV